jgi:thiamine-monophosphate kinase
LQALASHPAARGLEDDAAVLDVGGKQLVLTHDMIFEGVHFLPSDPPGDVAWKLLAVNLSDLAAKGAQPIGALLGYSLGSESWDTAFVEGLREALAVFDLPLLGGDTVSVPEGAPRAFGLTAIGEAEKTVPSRKGARSGDQLWVSGCIGDAGAGLRIARGEAGPAELLERYRRPSPRVAAGQALAPLASAMMDVSDGLLIDGARLGAASNAALLIDLDSLPLSDAYAAMAGVGRAARLAAATAGDDYELLFTAAPNVAAAIAHIASTLGLRLTRIGAVGYGSGLALSDAGGVVPLPDRLGYEHIGPSNSCS